MTVPTVVSYVMVCDGARNIVASDGYCNCGHEDSSTDCDRGF